MGSGTPLNGGSSNVTVPATTQTTIVKKTNWGVVVILFIVGLIVGGVATYFVLSATIIKNEREAAAQEKTALESRINTLEAQVQQLEQAAAGTTTGGTSTGGTGTAPTVGGITPDAQTSDWVVFNNASFHISFKYPSDYTVREFQSSADLAELEDEQIVYAVGIYKAGDPTPAGMIRVFKTNQNDGPDHRNVRLFKWVGTLPTSIDNQPAGAGVSPEVAEKEIILNGVDGFQFTAHESVPNALEPTPGGATYTGYFIEETFNASYLVHGCSTANSQAAIVGCLFSTTVSIK
jgi:type II secretory pathway pseudopilin PulG